METKTYYYIYKITILRGSLEDHYYIGKRVCHNCLPEEDIKYTGSGTKIYYWFNSKKRIAGIDYIKEIIHLCKDMDDMNNMETYYIGNKYETDPLCLNLMSGGHGGVMSKESRKKWKESMKNRPEEEKQKTKIKTGNSIKETLANRTDEEWEEISKNIRAIWTPEKCKEQSILLTKKYEEHPEYCQHISDGLKESYATTNRGERVSNSLLKFYEEHPEQHDIKSEEMKQYDIEHPERVQRISKTMRGKNKDKTYVNNGFDSKFVTKEEADYYVTVLGWNYGSLNGDKQTGSIYMTKPGEKVYQVIPRKQPEFIANGYYRCHRNGTPWEEKAA